MKKVIEAYEDAFKYIVVEKHGEDDFSITHTNDLEDETDGCSVRGSLEDIKESLAEDEDSGKWDFLEIGIALGELKNA